jgi:hypothetical protein
MFEKERIPFQKIFGPDKKAKYANFLRRMAFIHRPTKRVESGGMSIEFTAEASPDSVLTFKSSMLLHTVKDWYHL